MRWLLRLLHHLNHDPMWCPCRCCSECVRAGITMLSIGHRPALREHHSVIVEFDGSGNFEQRTLRSSDKEGLLAAGQQ